MFFYILNAQNAVTLKWLISIASPRIPGCDEKDHSIAF